MESIKKKKIILFGLILALIFLLIILVAWRFQLTPTVLVRIKGAEIKVEVAADPISRYNGLSRRDSLCPDCGMLFKFNDSAEREFAMREMEFPLDIIFINQGQIIKIAKNLPAEGKSQINIYSSDGLADSVLEVNAGYCARQGITAGDFISISQ
jgi:hypothetical protein